MIQIIAQYLTVDTDVGFLRIKQQYLSNRCWLLSFYVHSFTAIISLLAGFTQFSSRFRQKHLRWHKIFGRLYVLVVLILAAPSGLVLGIYANGHLPSKIGFSLLAVLWFWFTLVSFSHARSGRIEKHRFFMIRSYALALSAITLRIWKFGLANTLAPAPLDLYQLVTWLGFIPNLLIAEWIIYNIRHNSSNKF